MTVYRQTTLSEIFGNITVDWEATSRLFGEIICATPRKACKYKQRERK